MARYPQWNESAPCRVSVDLRRHQADDVAPEAFDEHQIEHVEAVVGKRFAPSVQRLLLLMRGVEDTEQSFGLDQARAFKAAREAIGQLLEACLDEWRDL